MNSYLDLVSEYGKIHSKKNRIIILCIAIAVCLVTAIFGMADMGIRSEIKQMIKEYGNYHILIKNIPDKTIKLIGSRNNVAHFGKIQEVPKTTFESKTLRVMGCDEDIAKQMGVNITQGHYPKNENEALLDEQAMKVFNLSLNHSITIKLSETTKKVYKIVGVYSDFSGLTVKDEHGLFLSYEGTQSIAKTDVHDCYITFKDHVNIKKSIEEIKRSFGLKGDQIIENDYLLSVMGQSGHTLARSLYLTAGFLFILVLISSTIMISNSFNMNVRERVKFFGLLRCLGATKSQIKKYVMLEGLRLSIKGIPIGVISGSIVIIIATTALKFLNKTLFGSMPLLQLSTIGIIAGTITGFLTVILSSLSPASKAAKVSPHTAVTGNSMYKNYKSSNNSKVIYSNKIPIDISMGLTHGVSSKKTFILMLASFALSIILFFGFSVFVNFMYHATRPMHAYTPDLAICSPIVQDKITPNIDPSLLMKIKEIQGVKRVYGRTFTELGAKHKEVTGKVELISYETNQFNWAKKDLIAGKIDENKLNLENMVLAEAETDFNVGDTIYINSKNGDKKVTVAGILSKTPFDRNQSVIGRLICSERLLKELTEIKDYTILDIQLDKNVSEFTVTQIRNVVPDNLKFQDMRIRNREGQNFFYTMAIFIYGFLIIIASITLFNIINSMNISVSSRINYYGVMRATGTSIKQLKRMVITEAITYAVSGCLVGEILGILLHYILYANLVTPYFHIPWTIPIKLILIIIVLILGITVVSVIKPIKKLANINIVDVIAMQ